MKKCFTFIVLFFSFSLSILASEFDITSQNVILYNLKDDSIIYEQNSEEKTSIASLTKIMTSLVAIEKISNLNAKVIITADDFVGTTGYAKAGFKVGDEVTYLDLLYGIILPSGAEAVNAIINNTYGNIQDFVTAMNNKAKEIGLKNTSFSNPIGKDDVNNYSTAKDIATLLKNALKNSAFAKIFTTKEYTATNGLLLESTLNSYANILDINLIKGAKSGFTQGAGRCLASITTLNGIDYLLVVIQSNTSQAYNAVKDSITIYDYYSSNYGYQEILNQKDIITSIPIEWSKEKSFDITGQKNVSLYLKNNTEITYEYVGEEIIKINTKKGTKLGIINVYDGNKIIYSNNIYLNKDISYYHPLLWIFGLLIFIIFIILVSIKKHKKNKLII